MVVSPQDRCLYCDYSLQGLPAPHRCPECGEAYDDATLIFRPRLNWRFYGPLIVGQIYVLYIIVSNWRSMVGWIGVVGTLLVIAAVVVLLSVRGYWLVRRMIVRPCQAALTRDELVVRAPNGSCERFPYDEIAFVSVIDVVPWVQRKEYGVERDNSRRQSHRISLKGIFENKSEKAEFKRMMTDRMSGSPIELACSPASIPVN